MDDKILNSRKHQKVYHIFSNFVIFKCPNRTWSMAVLEERAIMTLQNCHYYFGSVFTRICPWAHTYPLGHAYPIQLWEAPQVFQKSLARQLLCISSERLKAVQVSRWTSQNTAPALTLRHAFHKGMLGVPGSVLAIHLVTLWPVSVDGDLANTNNWH